MPSNWSLAQCTYMNETEPFAYREDLAQPTQQVLTQLLQALLDWGKAQYGR